MAIYRGPGGASDATNDATSQSIIATQAAFEAAQSAAAASASEVNAAASEVAANNSEDAAAISASSAASSATSAANALDEFTDLYLGAKLTDPTVDNDGNAIQTGALYFNTVANEFRVWTGTYWQVIVIGAIGDSVILQSYSGDGVETEFTLSTEPFSENVVLVFINGAYQQKNTYSISGTTLTFSEAPPLGTDNIEVSIITMADLSSLTAGIVNLEDADDYYESNTVEGALQEVGRKLFETVSVKDFGAVGDGVTDDTAAIQAAVDIGVAQGATVFFPRGIYYVTSTIFLDESAATSGTEPKCSLVGEPSGTIIKVGAGNFIALEIEGGITVGKHSHQVVENLIFEKESLSLVGTAIKLSDLAYFGAYNLLIRGFNRGMQIEDCLSSHFERIVIRANNQGMRIERNNNSQPNAITFISSNIAANVEYAFHCIKPTTFNFYGGSIENNGRQGTSDNAVYVFDGGNAGSVGVNFDGVYFEDNAGAADIFIEQAGIGCAHNISACTFNRITSTRYTTNNIRCTVGAFDVHLTLNSNGFSDFGTYVPDAGRPYLNLPTAANFKLTGINNFFKSSVERPWDLANYTTSFESPNFVGSFGSGTNAVANVGFAAYGDGKANIFRGRRAQNTGEGVEFNAQKARGSLASPSQLVDNDVIGNFSSDCWDGSQYLRVAQVYTEVDGTPSAGVVPTSFNVQLTNASGVLLRMLTLRANGTLYLATLKTYADNAAALAGGLVAGDVYKTATGELRIVV